jgi:anaerobic magnesium-protoporphyrin IX monomethyl ester cyclase
MNQPRITLVELPPTSFGKLGNPRVNDVYTKFHLPARANPLLYAILLQNGYNDVQSIDPNLNKKGKLTNENLERIVKSDYLLLSSISRTIVQTEELAIFFKKANPKGIVIAGGPHVTFTPEESLEWADIVVRHEGDKTLVELLERLENKKSYEDVKGISYKLDGKVVNNESRELLTPEELSALPAPNYSMYPKKTTGVVNTSRGCPYACDFCSVTQFYGNRYRRKSNSKILEELNILRGHVPDVFFTDDNFAANKPMTKELLREMIKIKNKLSYSCQLSINSAFMSADTNEIDEEFIKLLKEANFFSVYLGVESINQKTLESYNKPATAERNKFAVKAFRDAGLWCHGMMMIGGDGDTSESLDEELLWSRENLDSVQFFAPIPFPKTPFSEEMEKQERILTKDYCLYDGIHVLIKPKNFSPYELQQKLFEMHRKFYAIRGQRSLIRKSPHPWYKKIINVYAQKILRDIEHEPQTMIYLDKLKAFESLEKVL